MPSFYYILTSISTNFACLLVTINFSNFMWVLFSHFLRSYSPLSLFILKKNCTPNYYIWRGIPQNCRQIQKSLPVWLSHFWRSYYHFWKYSYILNGITRYFFSKDEECGKGEGHKTFVLVSKITFSANCLIFDLQKWKQQNRQRKRGKLQLLQNKLQQMLCPIHQITLLDWFHLPHQ